MRIPTTFKRLTGWMGRRGSDRSRLARRIQVERLEPRQLMAADIRVGMVYAEHDSGSDLEPDTFYIAFEGGAENTQLKRLVLNGDLYEPGLSRGDMIFDTISGGLGADRAHPFQIVELKTRNSNATVRATVEDGSSLLVLEFTNFYAGDTLIFTIDVDEVVHMQTGETNPARINQGLDPIASGIEFQETLFTAEFVAPHYENVSGTESFLNYYDHLVDPLDLPLPRDDDDGLHDRTTGVGLTLKQKPKPISIAGTVWVDSNEDLKIDSGERRLSGVEIELFVLQGSNYVTTGHKTTTDAQGRYSFGTQLGLQPGTYQIRETQPSGYYSVGSTIGKLTSGASVGKTVNNNPNQLTQIEMTLGDTHAIELNFAENLPSTLSGSVCYVVSGMDCLDENAVKAPQTGVLIELIDGSGKVIASTRTDSNGKYSFSNLRAGTYSIRQTNNPGFLDGVSKVGSGGGTSFDPNNITQIIINGGMELTDYRFCDLLPAEVSGHVYFDANNSGRRDPGETLLANVQVQLWNEAGEVVATTRTNAQGYYSFTNLRPGIYRITEQTPNGYWPGQAAAGSLGGQTDATGDVIRAIHLGSGASGIDYDFGELLPGSIQGRVFVDVNGNWVVDAQGEIVLPGVKVELLDQAGTVIATTITDSQGSYRFENLLPGRAYSVRETQPAGYFHGGQRAGSGGGNDSTADLISAIAIGPGEQLVNYDFRETPPASLSGYVFVDNNQDNARGTDEPPIGNVTITLVNESGTVVQTTVTDANGFYSFTGLRPGTYSVRQTQPAGYIQGSQRSGSGGGNHSIQDVISAISIPPAAAFVEYNFYELLPGSITGNVFVDNNQTRNREPGERSLQGIQIDLLDSSGNVIATTHTDANGDYRFDNLTPGTYGVRERHPSGYFQGGQSAPETGGNDSVTDVITQIVVGSGKHIKDANFFELEPGLLSGYVFQDGPEIHTAYGTVPDIEQIRDGVRTADDTPIPGVIVRLMLPDGSAAPTSLALPGFYSGDYIETVTDANGYYEFAGLKAGIYHVLEVHPEGYVDSIDTPGTTGGHTLPSSSNVEQFLNSIVHELRAKGFSGDLSGIRSLANDQMRDVIFSVGVSYGAESRENNFSEVLLEPETPAPPPPNLIPPYERPEAERELFPGTPPIPWQPMLWSPLPLILGVGHPPEMTWHLSVVNGGYPRGAKNGEAISVDTVVANTDHLEYRTWTVRGMKSSYYRYISANPTSRGLKTESVFHIPDARPLMGDFNGDGFDELALFVDGEWFIDVNGNGKWDEEDIWLKLGTKGDQPVVGDWDGDGKDDIGVFGPKWIGDNRALAAEPGMPDPSHFVTTKRHKNIPRPKDETPDEPRLMQPSRAGKPRADVIDHVFRLGGARDIAVSGDFNGDGVTTIGVFRDGNWNLDTNGDGVPESKFEFGAKGDLPLVGDFDGDGVDELAIVRGNRVIVDSNGNGKIDATDQVFLLEATEGTVIVGDFDGDGKDTPALYQSPEDRSLQARRNAG